MEDIKQQINEEAIKISQEITEILKNHNATQIMACYAMIYSINQMSSVTNPYYASIKLHPLTSFLE